MITSSLPQKPEPGKSDVNLESHKNNSETEHPVVSCAGLLNRQQKKRLGVGFRAWDARPDLKEQPFSTRRVCELSICMIVFYKLQYSTKYFEIISMDRHPEVDVAGGDCWWTLVPNVSSCLLLPVRC